MLLDLYCICDLSVGSAIVQHVVCPIRGVWLAGHNSALDCSHGDLCALRRKLKNLSQSLHTKMETLHHEY